MQFMINMLDVFMDGAVTDAQLFGGFLIAVAFGEEIQYLLFAWRQLVGFALTGANLFEGLDYFAGDAAGHGRASGINIFHRRQ